MDKYFFKVAAACPVSNISDVHFNVNNIIKCIDMAIQQDAKLIVLPELCITSYSCADLFFQRTLIEQSIEGLEKVCKYSKATDILIAVGAPIVFKNNLYDCAVIIKDGCILGIIPKSYIPNYNEFYEKRWFDNGRYITDQLINLYFQKNIPFGTNLIFRAGDLKFGFEICEDLWAVIPPSSYLSLNGANIIGNLSASNEIISKTQYRTRLVESQSAKCMCAYVYSSAGVYESSTDVVFGGHLMIAENGNLLKQNQRFQRQNQVICQIIDIDRLNNLRLKNSNFRHNIYPSQTVYRYVDFTFKSRKIRKFDRYITKYPFVPNNLEQRRKRCKEIFNIQKAALAKRLEHTKINKVVLGISGGLDSTLALLSVVKTFDMLNYPRRNIISITMPGFGTSDKTYNNAVNLCNKLKTDLRQISIVKSCIQHFKDISHSPDIHDTTYENAQARERTQILMDIANKENALLVGTGDLSELALGWATYNGDHMSMYSINCSIPKTLVRYLVEYVSQSETHTEISKILKDILNTPVSAELLPGDKQQISQKTEEIIGPYEVHDFFLYHMIGHCSPPDKVLFMACHVFKDQYSPDLIKKWLNLFIKRFFTQQFKRSALPDGPKVGTISLSPRGDWRMPSDASFNCWL